MLLNEDCNFDLRFYSVAHELPEVLIDATGFRWNFQIIQSEVLIGANF